jgi:uncharacterized protein YoxC
MSAIQRLNYFTSQFLVENDFQDEQAYHREMRHRHNRSLHTPGVVEGLIVSKAGDRQVKVSAGMAIDPEGQEMILLAESGAIALSGANTDVFVTIQYGETKEVPDTTSGLVNQFRRIQEEPAIRFSTSRPSAEGAAILLASVKLDANGNIVGDPNNQARTEAGAAVAPKSINTLQLGEGAVTTEKIAPKSVGTEQLGDGAVTKSKLAISPADIGAVAISGGNIQGSLTVTDTFKLKSGVAINEFSDDVNLSRNSSLAVPTVPAVKASVDALNKRIDTLTDNLNKLTNSVNSLNDAVNKRALTESLNSINNHLTESLNSINNRLTEIINSNNDHLSGIVNDLNRRVTKLER